LVLLVRWASVDVRDGQGKCVSYEGSVLTIMDPRPTDPAAHEGFEKDVRHLVEVLYHWVCLCLVAKLWNHISELVADEFVSLTFAYLSKPVISEIPVL